MSEQYLYKYINPTNHAEIIEELKSCPNLEAVKNLILRVFPDLIKKYTRGYCKDYPHLIATWFALCQAINTEPKGIALIEFVPPSIKDDIDENYSLLRKFLDTMTANGFVARRIEEFFLCDNCELAIPSYSLYKILKYIKPDKVPVNWDIKCSDCNKVHLKVLSD